MGTIASTSRPLVTPEDLLGLRDSVKYELVDGHLVTRHMGSESSEIALRIAFLLGLFLRDHRLGRLFGSDASYQCFAGSPRKVHRADVGFIRFDRLAGGKAPKGHCPVAPPIWRSKSFRPATPLRKSRASSWSGLMPACRWYGWLIPVSVRFAFTAPLPRPRDRSPCSANGTRSMERMSCRVLAAEWPSSLRTPDRGNEKIALRD